MEKQSLYIDSSYDNNRLWGTLYYDQNSTKALIQVFHGMAEHKERYDWFASKLVAAGYAVLTCDHRGHGENAKLLGYFAAENGWQENLSDLHALYIKAKAVINLPLVIFGHSMGSLIARSYLKRYHADIKGVILSGSPSYTPVLPLAKLLAQGIALVYGKKHPSKLLDKLSFGSFNSKIENPQTSFDWLSVNQDNVKAYIDDPLCGYLFTVSGYLDLFSGLTDVYKTKNWTITDKMTPILFISGQQDPCMVDIKGFENAIKTLSGSGYQNISSHLFDGLRHEILNETQRDTVFEYIKDFLKKIEERS